MILFPSGDPIAKLTWAVIWGLAIGSVIGALTDLLVIGRFMNVGALISSALLATTVFIACDVLCFYLDHHYQFWGTAQNPTLFLVSGIVLGIVGGTAYSLLLFTESGNRLLESLGL